MPPFRDIPNVPDVIDQVGVEQILTIFANLSGLDQSKFILNSKPYTEQGGYSNATTDEAVRILKQPIVPVVNLVQETPTVIIPQEPVKPHFSEVDGEELVRNKKGELVMRKFLDEEQ